jgi:N4-gp56 family major capsid protein
MDAAYDHIGNVELLKGLEKKFQRESWYNTFWGGMEGVPSITWPDNGNAEPSVNLSGMPIEMFSDNRRQGRDHYLMPFLKPLQNRPKLGDDVVKGHEEQMRLWWTRGYLNQFRHAVEAKSGDMANQRLKLYRLVEQARPLLSDYWAKVKNQMVFQAFYEGLSFPLSDSKDLYGLGVKKRYHPNWYFNDGGSLTSVGTTGGGKTTRRTTKTATNLDDANTNCDTGLTADILREFRTELQYLRIPQIVTKSGHSFWLLLVHPAQANKLKTETDFKSTFESAYQRTMEDFPMIKGEMVIGYYEGFLIIEEPVGIRGWDATNNDLFGDLETSFDEFISPTDVTANYNAIAVGKSAIGRAVGEALHFEFERDDYNNIEGVAGAEIDGFNRADFFAESNSGDSSGGAFERNSTGGVISATSADNYSSAILMTD